MRAVVDIEYHPETKEIWVICVLDIDTEKIYTFRHSPEENTLPQFKEFSKQINVWIGHHFIGADRPVLKKSLDIDVPLRSIIDTLVVSRLTGFMRLRKNSHSLESWGDHLDIPKLHTNTTLGFFREYSRELEERCLSDIKINLGTFRTLSKYIFSPRWRASLRVEHEVAEACSELHETGFGFDLSKAEALRKTLISSVSTLDEDITASFPPRTRLIREITPRETKHGTLNRSDFRWCKDGDLTGYSPGATFSLLEWCPFNPGSPSQIVQRLNEAGWRPRERTTGYLKASRARDTDKVEKYHRTNTGWAISEENLNTLPETAPSGARKLAERIMLQSRVSDLDEWIALVRASEGHWRVHGSFNGIGAWTHRMSHFKPNTANIATEKPQDKPEIAELNRELRTLWVARPQGLLVGVDADQIQLRVLAHYMQDERFTAALVNGDKNLGTDVHSLNVHAIGPACQGRRDAKTFIYSWLLGAGVARIAEILGCSHGAGKDARERFVGYYPGLKLLRERDIARDAFRGWFEGFDGRCVPIFGEDEDQRRHYCLGGYLQNGEKCVMAHATVIWRDRFRKEKLPVRLVNFVHDEWQFEIPENMELARYVGGIAADSIFRAGVDLGLRCPMKGSVNGGHDRLAVGKNWLDTH